jgi:hypothetical protein
VFRNNIQFQFGEVLAAFVCSASTAIVLKMGNRLSRGTEIAYYFQARCPWLLCPPQANRIKHKRQFRLMAGPMLPYQNSPPTHIKKGNRLLSDTLRDGAACVWR